MLERSIAIKCPDVGVQLAGSKKVQQELATEASLLHFLPDPKEYHLLKSTFVGLYSLDADIQGDNNAAMALKMPDRYVMKPQREGGGNNIYGKDIPAILSSLEPSKRAAYILMDLIKSPTHPALLYCRNKIMESVAISELGIYGIYLARRDQILFNDSVGYLVRTKPADVSEGGVVAGYACLDSVDLVE